MNKLALYCRMGFEREMAAEITDKAAEKGVFGFARVIENSGYVIFECYQADEADYLARELDFQQLIFARQMLVVSDLLTDLPQQDRITPIVQQYQQIADKIDLKQSTELLVETATTIFGWKRQIPMKPKNCLVFVVSLWCRCVKP